MTDPTYYGSHGDNLGEISTINHNENLDLISDDEGHITKSVYFKDQKDIGTSVFRTNGSVLFANIDAVLNLSNHVGGYLIEATSSIELDGTTFYSLFINDISTELVEYIQWRRPASIIRIITKSNDISWNINDNPNLQPIYVDVLKPDPLEIIKTRPADGYNLIGLVQRNLKVRKIILTCLIAYSILKNKVTKNDHINLKNDHINLKNDHNNLKKDHNLTTLKESYNENGKAFIVFPNKKSKLLDDIIHIIAKTFRNVKIFIPYFESNVICIGFSEPISGHDEIWANVWNKVEKRIPKRLLTFSKDYISNLDFTIDHEPLDRVEVLSLWQIPDEQIMNLKRAL